MVISGCSGFTWSLNSHENQLTPWSNDPVSNAPAEAVYIRDEVSSVTRPVKELRGFRRLALKPGESQTVEFRLGFDELSFLNRDMHRVVEPGTFKIMVGGNSKDLIDTTLHVAVPESAH